MSEHVVNRSKNIPFLEIRLLVSVLTSVMIELLILAPEQI